MRFAWIQGQQNQHSRSDLCQVLGVSRSGYYDWRDRPKSKRQEQSEQLAQQVRQAHIDSDRSYGTVRIYKELKAKGIACCRNTVAKLMKRQHLRAKTQRGSSAMTSIPTRTIDLLNG